MPPPEPTFHNRIGDVLAHIPYYAIRGQARLARDAGVSKSAVCRLMSGQSAPSFAVAMAVTEAVGQRLGMSLDPRELISLSGRYPTPSVCNLCGCRGCLPDRAYLPDDTLRPAYRSVPSGAWSMLPEPEDAAPP